MFESWQGSLLASYSGWSIGLFVFIIFLALWIDLKAHQKDEAISLKNAALWSAIWIAVSLAFAGYIWQAHGADKASLFLSGYLLEKSLSVDNLFVFMAIFSSFSVPDKYQHRILYFGILGALIFRFIFVSLGTSLLLLGPWVLAVFGLIVLYSAWHMWQASKQKAVEKEDYTNHWAVRVAKHLFRVHPHRVGHDFFTKKDGKWYVTPLFLCLITIEISDIMFAFDSVPAIIAVTQELFLVYTSNIFAILGLRSLYFLLAAAKRFLCHLEKAVIGLLAFIGVKILLGALGIYHLPPQASLMIVLGFLTIGIVASFLFPKENKLEP